MNPQRSPPSQPLTASGIEGDVEFKLSAGVRGICVEKRWRRAGVGAATHAMSFTTRRHSCAGAKQIQSGSAFLTFTRD